MLHFRRVRLPARLDNGVGCEAAGVPLRRRREMAEVRSSGDELRTGFVCYFFRERVQSSSSGPVATEGVSRGSKKARGVA